MKYPLNSVHACCMHTSVYFLFQCFFFRVFSFYFNCTDPRSACSSCEPLQLYISTDDPVPIDPGLSRGPSPVGSPVYDRLTIKSWELHSDVECAVGVEMPRKKKTIA